jgi:hypothetical protein
MVRISETNNRLNLPQKLSGSGLTIQNGIFTPKNSKKFLKNHIPTMKKKFP